MTKDTNVSSSQDTGRSSAPAGEARLNAGGVGSRLIEKTCICKRLPEPVNEDCPVHGDVLPSNELVRKRMEFEAEQHAKKCVELADVTAERDRLRGVLEDIRESCDQRAAAMASHALAGSPSNSPEAAAVPHLGSSPSGVANAGSIPAGAAGSPTESGAPRPEAGDRPGPQISGQQFETGARTPQDFAIEHAEYMAVAAEQLIAADNLLCVEGTSLDVIDQHSEASRTLENRIYEFRKRADRAKRPAMETSGERMSCGVHDTIFDSDKGCPGCEAAKGCSHREVRPASNGMYCPDCGLTLRREEVSPRMSPMLGYHYGRALGEECCIGEGRMYGPDAPPPTCEHGNPIHWHT